MCYNREVGTHRDFSATRGVHWYVLASGKRVGCASFKEGCQSGEKRPANIHPPPLPTAEEKKTGDSRGDNPQERSLTKKAGENRCRPSCGSHGRTRDSIKVDLAVKREGELPHGGIGV